METSMKFWDKTAERYSKQPIADEATYQKKIAKTREYLTPESMVLEFGCGTGSTSIQHAPYVKYIHAIDISSKMIEIANSKQADGKSNNVTFTRATLSEFKPADRSLDMVLGLNILHLLDNWQETITDVHRMLKPGGVFITSTVCLTGWTRLVPWIAPLGKLLRLMPDVYTISMEGLKQQHEHARFTIDYELVASDHVIFLVAKKAG